MDIAFIPIIGDIVVAFLSYYLIIKPAKQADLPPSIVNKMFFNNVVSVALSYVPSHLPNNTIDELCFLSPHCRRNSYIRHYQPSNRFIPLIGDILIGVWKVNLRNATLFEEFLRVRGEEYLKGGGQAIRERAIVSVRCRRINTRWQSINWVEPFRNLLTLFSAVPSQVLVAAGVGACKMHSRSNRGNPSTSLYSAFESRLRLRRSSGALRSMISR